MANEVIVTEQEIKGIRRTSNKILLYSEAGEGKSTSIATIIPTLPEGGRLCFLITENNAISGFEFGIKHYNIQVKPGQVFYSVPKAPTIVGTEKVSGFGNLLRATKRLHTEKQETRHDAKDIKGTSNREKYGFLVNIIQGLNQFKGIDYVTGEIKNLGDVENLTEKDVLVIDGNSPITHEIWKIIYGDVLIHSATDYGPVQKYLYDIYFELSKLSCGVVLLSHKKAYTKPSLNSNDWPEFKQYGPDTDCGDKNFNRLMGNFGYVILAKKEDERYFWVGEERNVYTRKGIKLQINPEKRERWNQLPPDFRRYDFFN